MMLAQGDANEVEHGPKCKKLRLPVGKIWPRGQPSLLQCGHDHDSIAALHHMLGPPIPQAKASSIISFYHHPESPSRSSGCQCEFDLVNKCSFSLILVARLKRSSYYDPDYRQSAALIRARRPYLFRNMATGAVIFSFALGVCMCNPKAASSSYTDLPLQMPSPSKLLVKIILKMSKFLMPRFNLRTLQMLQSMEPLHRPKRHFRYLDMLRLQ